MNLIGTASALLLLFLSLRPCTAEPVQHQDISASSPWAAHLDLHKLSSPPLKGFLDQVVGFDRALQLQNAMKEQLAINWKSLRGVTFYGVGKQSTETAIIFRGDFQQVNLTNLPLLEDQLLHHGSALRKGPNWQQSPLLLASHSDQAWAAGTSLKAVQSSLDLLAKRGESSRSPEFPTKATKELNSAAAMFSLDMKKLNSELKFRADFTRAIQNLWFLIDSEDNQIKASLVIHSTDAEGLIFLQNQFQMLSLLLMSQADPQIIWQKMIGAVQLESDGNWMTIKLTASPDQAALFLKSLAPLFVEAPTSSSLGN